MKIHLKDHNYQAEDWTQSPHIERAIKSKNWAVCKQIIPDPYITDDRDQVTCCACLMHGGD